MKTQLLSLDPFILQNECHFRGFNYLKNTMYALKQSLVSSQALAMMQSWLPGKTDNAEAPVKKENSSVVMSEDVALERFLLALGVSKSTILEVKQHNMMAPLTTPSTYSNTPNNLQRFQSTFSTFVERAKSLRSSDEYEGFLASDLNIAAYYEIACSTELHDFSYFLEYKFLKLLDRLFPFCPKSFLLYFDDFPFCRNFLLTFIAFKLSEFSEYDLAEVDTHFQIQIFRRHYFIYQVLSPIGVQRNIRIKVSSLSEDNAVVVRMIQNLLSAKNLSFNRINKTASVKSQKRRRRSAMVVTQAELLAKLLQDLRSVPVRTVGEACTWLRFITDLHRANVTAEICHNHDALRTSSVSTLASSNRHRCIIHNAGTVDDDSGDILFDNGEKCGDAIKIVLQQLKTDCLNLISEKLHDPRFNIIISYTAGTSYDIVSDIILNALKDDALGVYDERVTADFVLRSLTMSICQLLLDYKVADRADKIPVEFSKLCLEFVRNIRWSFVELSTRRNFLSSIQTLLLQVSNYTQNGNNSNQSSDEDFGAKGTTNTHSVSLFLITLLNQIIVILEAVVALASHKKKSFISNCLINKETIDNWSRPRHNFIESLDSKKRKKPKIGTDERQQQQVSTNNENDGEKLFFENEAIWDVQSHPLKHCVEVSLAYDEEVKNLFDLNLTDKQRKDTNILNKGKQKNIISTTDVTQNEPAIGQQRSCGYKTSSGGVNAFQKHSSVTKNNTRNTCVPGTENLISSRSETKEAEKTKLNQTLIPSSKLLYCDVSMKRPRDFPVQIRANCAVYPGQCKMFDVEFLWRKTRCSVGSHPLVGVVTEEGILPLSTGVSQEHCGQLGWAVDLEAGSACLVHNLGEFLQHNPLHTDKCQQQSRNDGNSKRKHDETINGTDTIKRNNKRARRYNSKMGSTNINSDHSVYKHTKYNNNNNNNDCHAFNTEHELKKEKSAPSVDSCSSSSSISLLANLPSEDRRHSAVSSDGQRPSNICSQQHPVSVSMTVPIRIVIDRIKNRFLARTLKYAYEENIPELEHYSNPLFPAISLCSGAFRGYLCRPHPFFAMNLKNIEHTHVGSNTADNDNSSGISPVLTKLLQYKSNGRNDSLRLSSHRSVRSPLDFYFRKRQQSTSLSLNLFKSTKLSKPLKRQTRSLLSLPSMSLLNTTSFNFSQCLGFLTSYKHTMSQPVRLPAGVPRRLPVARRASFILRRSNGPLLDINNNHHHVSVVSTVSPLRFSSSNASNSSSTQSPPSQHSPLSPEWEVTSEACSAWPYFNSVEQRYLTVRTSVKTRQSKKRKIKRPSLAKAFELASNLRISNQALGLQPKKTRRIQ